MHLAVPTVARLKLVIKLVIPVTLPVVVVLVEQKVLAVLVMVVVDVNEGEAREELLIAVHILDIIHIIHKTYAILASPSQKHLLVNIFLVKR